MFVGRFQPFHKGHEYALEYILEREDEVIIAIGSSQKNYTYDNPLTCGERIEIIWHFLKKKNLLDKCIICSIPDIHNNILWPHHVRVLVPRFDIVYSGNNFVIMLFKEHNIPTHLIKEINKDNYSGTNIRKLILERKEWRHLVPKEIIPLLNALRFEERVLKLRNIRS